MLKMSEVPLTLKKVPFEGSVMLEVVKMDKFE